MNQQKCEKFYLLSHKRIFLLFFYLKDLEGEEINVGDLNRNKTTRREIEKKK
jgi:hypothetical protein